jgi:hypothetical protein
VNQAAAPVRPLSLAAADPLDDPSALAALQRADTPGAASSIPAQAAGY